MLLVMYVFSCWCVALGERLHVLFISHIPRMTMPTNRNELRRFILLIDALYEAHTRVIILADVPVMELLTISAADRASSVHDEVRALLIYTILYYTILYEYHSAYSLYYCIYVCLYDRYLLLIAPSHVC